jgi:pyruvate/2-oxoglutarate/acetoin dehydrogenase E1 component
MGMGIGAAMTGLRPIVEGMNMGFLLLAYNQISNNAGMLHYTSGGQYKVSRCRCSISPPLAWEGALHPAPSHTAI